MGQSSSQLDSQRASRQIANFYHICNIIPDTPEHHHQIWSLDIQQHQQQTKATSKKTASRRKSRHHSSYARHTSSYGKQQDVSSDEASTDRHRPIHSFPSNRFASSATDYTTDDESDVFSHRREPSRSKNRNRKRTSGTPHSHATTPELHVQNGGMESFPQLLDRRYDLDIAPSMINMNLRFNGAYMVVNSIYNILTCKFGYQHMLSVQMLFWMAVHKYYQIHLIDVNANYKLSLSTLLDIVKHMSLCPEREVSIYTDVAKQYGSHTQESNTSKTDTQTTSPHTFHITALVSKDMHQLPFYQMQYYYVPKEESTLKQALLNDHLILANLTLFSNFLSSRGGVVRFPNSTDTSAGMIVVTIVGYQNDTWIVRFPFGIHWGDQGIGYVSFEYFDRYNRDRWIIDIEECAEPPQYVAQRQKEQLSENSELLAAHMNTSIPHEQDILNHNQIKRSTKTNTSPDIVQKTRRRII